VIPIEGETADFVPTKGVVYDWRPAFQDYIRIKGVLSFRSNSVDRTFNPLIDTVQLSFGDITNGVGVTIFAGDPGWKGKPGKKWKYKSGQYTSPRYRLTINLKKGDWQFKYQSFKFRGPQRNPFRFTIRAGNDFSVADTVWEEYKPGRFKLR
ncbi:hypothetical protein HQ590_07645, partial [bacterium]|nr:hypothetical protein [bacterium]